MKLMLIEYEDDGLPPPKIRKLLRQSAAMTQAEMGAKLGVTGSAVSGWETGSSPIGDLRVAYARVLRDLRTELAGDHAY